MLITVDFAGETPIYAQIRDQIIVGIAGKALAPGEALPSVRRMAADIGVHAHTVNKAYTALRDGGYIVIDRRSGCRVSDRVPAADREFTDELCGQLLPIISSAACRHLGAEEFKAVCDTVFQKLEGKS